MNIALHRFLHNYGKIPTEGSRDYALLLFRMTSKVLYSAQDCMLHAFVQFGALYMHNHDDKYPYRPGFEPGTSRLQAQVDTNEPSGSVRDPQLQVGENYSFLFNLRPNISKY